MPDPLEQFLIEYVDAVGGLADPIEPQVYDVLLPEADKPLRAAFDSDALPEHPSAQLLTFGSPLLDELLERAQERGRVALAYLDDVHLPPHSLEQRVQRELTLPEGLTLSIEFARPQYVTHSLLWFEATYSSDEKEQALYPVAVDRYYGRLVRYLETLLDGERLGEIRRWAYPDARSRPLEPCYQTARDSVLRTVRAEAHHRREGLQTRQEEQAERMRRYYADLRAEFEERLAKANARGEETESLRSRIDVLEREQALRLEELQRKTQLRVHMQLTNLLHVKVPRLFVTARVTAAATAHARVVHPSMLDLTWDPLVEKADPLECPNCHLPTLELRLDRQGLLHCPNCAPARKR